MPFLNYTKGKLQRYQLMDNGAKRNGIVMVLGSSRADEKITFDHCVESVGNDYINTAPKETLLNPSSTARTRLEAKSRLWKKTGFFC